MSRTRVTRKGKEVVPLNLVCACLRIACACVRSVFAPSPPSHPPADLVLISLTVVVTQYDSFAFWLGRMSLYRCFECLLSWVMIRAVQPQLSGIKRSSSRYCLVPFFCLFNSCALLLLISLKFDSHPAVADSYFSAAIPV